eukprot:scaffold1384_cov256-Pinguiococcus_pyrenoidosus.AAC.6
MQDKPEAHPFALPGQRDAETALGALLHELVGKASGVVRDGGEAHLLGGEPQRQVSGSRFDEHAEEALNGAEDGPVDHDRALPLGFGGDVLHVEALGEVEVALDGRALPRAADGILNLDVNLGAVEGTATIVHLVAPTLAIQRLDECLRTNGSDPGLRTSVDSEVVRSPVPIPRLPWWQVPRCHLRRRSSPAGC